MPTRRLLLLASIVMAGCGETSPAPDAYSTKPVCGNGVREIGEECDLGSENSKTGACSEDCRAARCGDGIVNAGEVCDDGNSNDGDACPSTCTRCGDGVESPGEECDDGNSSNGDGCDALCRPGGTIVWRSTDLFAFDIATGATGFDLLGGSSVTSLDPEGNVLWSTAVSSSGAGSAKGRAITRSGDRIIVVGEITQGTTYVPWAEAIDSSGVLWEQTYDVGENASGSDVAVLQDGLVMGLFSGDASNWLLTIDPTTGALVQKYTYPGRTGHLLAVRQNLVAFGGAKPTGGGDYDRTVTILSRSATGMVMTGMFDIPSTWVEWIGAMTFDPNGNLLVSGFTAPSAQSNVIWIAELSTAADVLWSESPSESAKLGFEAEGNTLLVRPDGAFYVGGYYYSGGWLSLHTSGGVLVHQWTLPFLVTLGTTSAANEGLLGTYEEDDIGVSIRGIARLAL